MAHPRAQNAALQAEQLLQRRLDDYQPVGEFLSSCRSPHTARGYGPEQVLQFGGSRQTRLEEPEKYGMDEELMQKARTALRYVADENENTRQRLRAAKRLKVSRSNSE